MMTEGAYRGPGYGDPAPASQVTDGVQSPTETGPDIYPNYQHRTSKVLGFGRVVIGVIITALEMAALGLLMKGFTVDANIFFAMVLKSGIWKGIFFCVAGSFGVGAASRKNKCMVITNLVLAIVSAAVFVLPCVIDSSYQVADFMAYGSHGHHNRRFRYVKYSLVILLALIECVLDIWSAVICYKVVRCCTSHRYSPPPVQFVTTPPGQEVVYVANPTAPPVDTGQQYASAAPTRELENSRGSSAPPPSYQYVVDTKDNRTPLIYSG